MSNKSLMKIFSALCFCLLVISNNAFADPKIYWADKTNAKIYRARVYDKVVVELPVNLSVSAQPESLAIDEKNAKLYWSEAGTNKIRRSDLDGANVEDVVANLTSPTDITFDPIAEKVYWISNGNSILRASVTGDSASNEVSTQQVRTVSAGVTYLGIAFEPDSQKLYWSADTSGVKAVYSAAVTTVPITSPTSSSVTDATAIAFNILEFYWASPTTVSIEKSGLDFTSGQSFVTVANSPYRMAASQFYTRLFWSDPVAKTIDFTVGGTGSTVSTFTTVSGTPSGVAADCSAYFPSSTVKSYVDDCYDFCPNDSSKTNPGYCGCGVVEDTTDSDADGLPDCIDFCPLDAGSLAPTACNSCFANLDPNEVDADTVFTCLRTCRDAQTGNQDFDCGCGTSAEDDDGDGTINCADECPLDARKIVQGACDCGLIDSYDADGTLNCGQTRPVAPGTKIETPPVIVVTKKTAKVVMEKFKSAALKKYKPKSSSAEADVVDEAIVALLEAKAKATFEYEVTVKKSGGHKNDIRKTNSKRNQVTFKNLSPGNYTSTYRVNISSNGKQVGRSTQSPKATFTIP